MTTAAHPHLRFGLLGAARIAPAALIDPATRLDVDVVAVAARDPERATEFAKASLFSLKRKRGAGDGSGANGFRPPAKAFGCRCCFVRPFLRRLRHN